MDTSKDYYESVMRDFQTYGRGRTLEQYCRDEAVDFRWIEKAISKYGIPEKTKVVKTQKRTKSKSPDMIQLHFEQESEDTGLSATAGKPLLPCLRHKTAVECGKWRASRS